MRVLLVEADKKFKITIPDDAKVTFGPWSPPSKTVGFREETDKRGTLRIYQGSKENIIACFAGVRSFRDLSMGFSEEVVVEEGASIWKDDQQGYVREHKTKVTRDWVNGDAKLLASPKATTKKEKA